LSFQGGGFMKRKRFDFDEIVELEGEALEVFSNSRCPRCHADIIFPDKDNPETECCRCGATYLAEFDEHGFLLRVYRL